MRQVHKSSRQRVTMLVLTLLLLGSCGFGANAPLATTTQTVADTAATVGQVTPAAGMNTPPTNTTQAGQALTDSNTVPISFGAFDADRQSYQPLIDSFNQRNPGIHVQFVALDDLYRSSSSQSEVADRISRLRGIVGRVDTASAFVDQSALGLGLVHDLKPLMDADASFSPDDFYPPALPSLTANGGIWGVPSSINVWTLAYNKALWTARGLPTPKPDWTWQDLQAAAEQLTQKQGNTVSVYGLVDNTAYYESVFNGLPLQSTPPEQLHFDQPEVAAALEHLAGLVKSGAFYHWPATGSANWNELEQLVRDQKVGIWRSDIVQKGTTTLNYATGTLPYPARTNPGDSAVSVNSYLMSSGTQHPNEAWDWLSFLSKQVAVEHNPSPNLPARKSVAQQSGYWSQLDPEATAAVQTTLARPLLPPAPSSVDDSRIFDPLAQALEAIIGGTPTKQALRQAQTALGDAIVSIHLTPTATPDTRPVVVEAPAPDVAPPGATTITFGAPPKGTDQLRKIAQQFNQANSAIFVHLKESDPKAGPPSMTTLAATTDCWTSFGPPASGDLAALLDLQPLIDADPSFKLDDYPSVLIAPYRDGSRLTGLPWQVAFNTINYNKDAFDAAGLQPPTTSWTMDDFINGAQKLTSGTGNSKKYGFVMPRAQPEHVRFMVGLLGAALQHGSGANLKPNYTEPKVLQATRAVVDLLRHSTPHARLEGYTNTPDMGDRPYDSLVADGHAAMWFGSGLSPYGGDPHYTLQIAPPPLKGAILTPDATFTVGLEISAHTDKHAACWSWFKYLSSSPSQMLGAMPARRSVAESDAVKQSLPGATEVYQAYDSALKGAAAAPTQSQAGTVQIDYYWFDRAVDRALQGKDLERELADAQQHTEQFLACRSGGETAANCATQVDPSYQGVAGR